ncbi:uncharacterized protein PS065_000695 [Dugong dugon]
MGPREPPLRGANSKKPIVSGLSDRGHGKKRGQRTKAPGSHPRGSPDLETATRPNAALQPRRREQRRPSEPGTQAKGGGGGRKRSARCQQTAPRKPPARARRTQAPAPPPPRDPGHGKQRGERTKAPGSHPRGSPDPETATRPHAAPQPRRREQRQHPDPGTQAKGGGGGRKRSARCQQTAPRKPPARARGTQAPAPPCPGTPATESRGANEQRPRDPTHAGAQTQKQPHARTQPYSPAGESRDGTRNQAPRLT